MIEQLRKLEARYRQLEELLASPEVLSDKETCNKYAKELASLREPVGLFREHQRLSAEIAGLEVMLNQKHDSQFLDMAKKEVEELKAKKIQLEQQIESFLKGEDKDLGRDIILEIRPGTGGLEAGLFAGDLYRMYSKYAANKNWIIEPMAIHANEAGGYKEIIFSVHGKEAFKRLRFESGVHRVQRVPETESQGRIHTSTATVAVLPNI